MEKTYRISNKELVQLLKEILAAMEVKNYSSFRIRAYQNAIVSMEGLTSSVYDLWQNKRLEEIQGVGEGMSQHLNELFTTGDVNEFKVVRECLPEGMFSLIGIRGIGAKRAFKLATELHLNSRETAVELLGVAAKDGLINQLEGFGEKLERDILSSVNEAKMNKNEKQRLLLFKAEEISNRIIQYVKTFPGVEQAIALGSLRRRNPTVGDLDIAVVHENPEKVLKHFLKFPEIKEVLVMGDKKVAVVLTNDVQVDVRVAMKESVGSMIQYSTGNKQHNVKLRTFAILKNMSLSEYGIKYKGELHEFATEEQFYKFIGVPYIEPELRQGKDEIELALSGKLPKLVKLEDVKGDLHMHTVASDGLNTLAEMVAQAKTLGYKYIGISDHAPSVQSRGLAEVVSIIEAQRKAIDAVNASQKDVKVFFGYEVNILADATLGLPDELLEKLDYVIASVHTAFTQSREVITNRVVKALENPFVTILGHPSGRLINERDPIDVDWENIFKTAVENNKIIEINGQPNRLDLAEDLVRDASKRGVKFIVATDAHDVSGLGFMKYAIDVARRGFCEKSVILNTLDIPNFLR